ncbi:MAG: BCCT transporter [Alteromonadaceae bacterium]|nr:MAG: BCCT transporter [Alteromonadaceae bacterium]
MKYCSKGNIALLICISLAFVFLLYPLKSVTLASAVTQFAVQRFALFFIIFSSLIVLACVGLALGPYGRFRLGGENAKPEFGFFSWMAMLFAAGMGSGLIFWGVAEPLFHFSNPPAFASEHQNPKAMALALTYFHWGFHAWAIYALCGLAMAWFAFNRGRDISVSASFVRKGQEGRAAAFFVSFDLLAVIAIIFGVAGTLANTIALVQSGVQSQFGLNVDVGFRVGLLLLIALVFTASSLLGLNKGIKRLSQFNLIFALLLLLLVVLWSNPITVAKMALSSTFLYLSELPRLSFTIDPESRGWSEGWSVIYLVWWIAWAPFVGPFIARISRGRSVRQFIFGVTVLPVVGSIIWFSAFAGGAFNSAQFADMLQAVNQDYTQGLFAFFSTFPRPLLLSISALLLLITFVVTSADSAIYVAAMLTGRETIATKVAWSSVLVAISVALIYRNNIDLNKQIAIIGAVPFTFILLAQGLALWQDMHKYSRDKKR